MTGRRMHLAIDKDKLLMAIGSMYNQVRGLNREIVAEREQALERACVAEWDAVQYGTDLEAAQEALTEARRQLAATEAACAANEAEIRKKQAIQEKLKPYLEAALKLEKLTQLSHTLHQAEKVDDLLRRWKRLMEIIRKCQDPTTAFLREKKPMKWMIC